MSSSNFVKRQQHNTPTKLYSSENIADTLNKQTAVLENGAVGIDFNRLPKPGHLANSAVLRFLEEEEVRKQKGFKRIAWPPPSEEEVEPGLIEEQAPVYAKTPEYSHAKTVPPSFTQPETSPRSWESQIGSRTTPPSVPVGQPAQIFKPVKFQPPPTIIKLRPSPPIEQPPPPIFESQPATLQFQGGVKMRGDEKWPPAPVKQQTAEENEARKAIARGPVFRPRRVKKDYSSFFAQNALNSNYPAYRAPPGTQHYLEDGTSQL